MKTPRVVLGAFLISGATVSAQETSTPTFEVGPNYSWFHVTRS
ncbi:MAG TPA: hypothetical protein VK789_02380 [Bryobacteraceae bacterium]|nr:hypothetical protein [Bryobacteraceae bacterium]